MRDKYWAMYVELINAKFYYWHYRAHSAFLEKVMNIILCISSAYGISSWFIWKEYAWIWAVIIGASQILSSIRHLLPYSVQISSVSLLLPELKTLTNEVDRDWSRIDTGEISDTDTNELIYKYRDRFICLENKYIKDISFPRKKLCENRALNDRKNYFFENYNIKEEENRKGKKYVQLFKWFKAKSSSKPGAQST